MRVTLQDQDLGLGLNHLIWSYYLILTWSDIFISKTNYNPLLETKDGSCNNYGLLKEILVWKQSPIAVFTDFTDDLGLCISHEVSKMLIVSERDSDFGVLTRLPLHRKIQGENPLQGLAWTFNFLFRAGNIRVWKVPQQNSICNTTTWPQLRT